MESSNYFQLAPDFSPFKKSSVQLLENLPTVGSGFGDVVLALSAIYLFQARDAAKDVNDPTEYVNQEIFKAAELLKTTKNFNFGSSKKINSETIEEITEFNPCAE
jgi:hypothetical protein